MTGAGNICGHRRPPHAAWLQERVVIMEGLDRARGADFSGERREGGRGVFLCAEGDATCIPQGTLLVEEAPLVLARDYPTLERYLLALCSGAQSCPPADLGVAVTSGESQEAIRHAVATMYAGPGSEGASLRQRVRGVLARNMHTADPLPWNGCPPDDSGPIGLWPTGSMINHSFTRPNVARSFVQKSRAVQYRAIREIHPGEELLDNYLDSCSSYVDRARIMRNQHGLTEARDGFDCAPALLAEATAAITKARARIAARAHDEALYALLPLRERLLHARPACSCDRSGTACSCARKAVPLEDPALAVFFDTLGEVALAADLPDLAQSNWERALELVTKREPSSYRSAMLAARLALGAKRMEAAAMGGVDADAPERPAPVARAKEDADRWMRVAREHWRVVFGSGDGIEDLFESRNQLLLDSSGTDSTRGEVFLWGGPSAQANVGGDVLASIAGGCSGGPISPAGPSGEVEAGTEDDGQVVTTAPKRPHVDCQGLLAEDDAAWAIFA